jgi:hypothetical protein
MDRYKDEPKTSEADVDLRVAYLYPLAYILFLIFGTYRLFLALGIGSDDCRGSKFYGVEIVGVKASDSANPQDDDAAAARSSSARFDLTARVSNHYRGQRLRTLCLTNWQSSIWFDGIPLGQGSFPRTVCVGKSGEATVTASTSTELLGLAKEVHRHMATHESMGELELQIDMSFLASLIGNDDRVYDTRSMRLWCTSGPHSQSAPTSCRLNVLAPGKLAIELM